MAAVGGASALNFPARADGGDRQRAPERASTRRTSPTRDELARWGMFDYDSLLGVWRGSGASGRLWYSEERRSAARTVPVCPGAGAQAGAAAFGLGRRGLLLRQRGRHGGEA